MDLISLIALAVAVVVFFRLRSVLGRRTGNERPPSDTMRRFPNPSRDSAESGNKDNVVRLPGAEREEEAPRREYAPAGTPLAAALAQIGIADRNFDPEDFLNGARGAHEMIVNAYGAGDRTTLKKLTDPEVFAGFEAAISAREEAGQHLEQSYVGLTSADITDAELDGRVARVTVRFVSEIISALRDKDGEIVEGSPEAVRAVTDVWTFERDTSSRDPNWKLVATGSA